MALTYNKYKQVGTQLSTIMIILVHDFPYVLYDPSRTKI